MKFNKKIYLLIPFILTVAVQACGSSSHTYYEPYPAPNPHYPPSQAEMDAVNSSMDDFLLQEAQFVDDSILGGGIVDCLALEEALLDLEGVVACSHAGDFEATLLDFHCDDFGSIQADFTIDYQFYNCQDDVHGIKDGSLTVSWDWSTEWLEFTLDSSMMDISGLEVEYENTSFDFSNGVESCGGTTYYDDYACDWKSDCTCILVDAYKEATPIELQKQNNALLKRNFSVKD